MRRFLLIFLGASLLCSFKGWADDQIDQEKHYWDGTQLSNQSRLGQTFDGFETEKRKNAQDVTQDQYLAKIRQQMVNQAKADQHEAMLNFGTDMKSRAFSVSSASGKREITLNLPELFDENSASLKAGATEVLNQVAALLNVPGAPDTKLTLHDDLDATPAASTVDGERADYVAAYLNLSLAGSAS